MTDTKEPASVFIGDDGSVLKSTHLVILQLSVLVVALCGIAYELIIGTVSSYLLGNSVYQFSLTIGFFMFAMGIGSYLSKFINSGLVTWFIAVEMLVALVGGVSSMVLFLLFPYNTVYQFAMYGFIITIGTLVGLEIPILTRAVSATRGFKISIAHVLSLDYLGALIGSLIFPLFLLPKLGLFSASFAIGLLNVIVAMFTVFVFKGVLKNYKIFFITSVLIAILLVLALFISNYLTSFAQGRLFMDNIIYEKQTPYQHMVVTRNYMNKEIRLYLDGHIQFASKDEYRYHEALVHPVMSLPGKRERVLILGGGDGLAIREVLKYKDVKHIDLVDIDKEVTTLSSTFQPIVELNNSSLKNPIVHIHNIDAFQFLQTKRSKYDRVIVDLPDPHNESLSKLYSMEFYQLIKNSMESESSYFVTQSSSPFFTKEVFWCIAKTIEHVGFNPFSYKITVPSFGLWGFTLASYGKTISNNFKFTVPTRFLTTHLMEGAARFGKDISRIDTPINSIFEPKIYEFYLKGIKR